MGKFKTGLVQQQIENTEAAREQETLHKVHHIEDENVVVVEKKSLLKFLIKTVGVMIKVLATIALVILAAIGILALVYPGPREELIEVYNENMATFMQFLGR